MAITSPPREAPEESRTNEVEETTRKQNDSPVGGRLHQFSQAWSLLDSPFASKVMSKGVIIPFLEIPPLTTIPSFVTLVKPSLVKIVCSLLKKHFI